MYKITLSIPIYNCAATIEKCLLSALEQSYSNIEYILVDDKGNDNSIEIVSEFLKSHPRKSDVTIYSHSCNMGRGAVNNTTIKYATGDYLFFMDSDDTITADCIEYLVSELGGSDFDMVVGSYQRIDQKGQVIDEKILEGKVYTSNAECISAFIEKKAYYIPNWGKLYKLSLFRDNNISFINGMHQDTPASFALALCQHKIKLCSKVIYHWIFTEGSVSTRIYKYKNYKAFEESFFFMLQTANNYTNASFYSLILTYVNNYRLYPIWQLLTVSNMENKQELLRNFMLPILSVKNVLFLPLNCKEKIKHSLFILPFFLKLGLFKCIHLILKNRVYNV